VLSLSTKAFKSPRIPLNETVQPVIPFNDGTKDPEPCDVSRKKQVLMGLFFTFRARQRMKMVESELEVYNHISRGLSREVSALMKRSNEKEDRDRDGRVPPGRRPFT